MRALKSAKPSNDKRKLEGRLATGDSATLIIQLELNSNDVQIASSSVCISGVINMYPEAGHKRIAHPSRRFPFSFDPIGNPKCVDLSPDLNATNRRTATYMLNFKINDIITSNTVTSMECCKRYTTSYCGSETVAPFGNNRISMH